MWGGPLRWAGTEKMYKEGAGLARLPRGQGGII